MVSTTSRKVLVTGCASGIGLATARRFAEAGDTVVASVRRLDRADELRSTLTAIDSSSEVLELDITGDDVETIIADIIDRHGGLDVVVNNAGLAVEGTLEDLPIADLRYSLEVNFFGTARVTKAVLPSMRAARSGHIIAVSSLSGTMGMAFQEPYSAAKFALEGLFECTAPVAAMFGVRLTLVEPGPVGGDFITKPTAVVAGPSEPYAEMYERFVSMRNRAYADCPDPGDVAEVIHGVSLRDDPPLRLQDTEATTQLVATKLTDVDGSRALGSRALFAPDEGC